MSSKQQWWVQIGNPDDDGWYPVKWEGEGAARVRFAAGKISELRLAQPTTEKLRRVPLSRIELAAGAGGGIGKQRYKLRRPAGRRLGPEFYANVATAYRDAAARGMRHPRKALVDDTGAADATVAAWIMEARRRGYLPPAEPGKATA